MMLWFFLHVIEFVLVLKPSSNTELIIHINGCVNGDLFKQFCINPEHINGKIKVQEVCFVNV